MRRQERTVADGVVGRILGGRLLGAGTARTGGHCRWGQPPFSSRPVVWAMEVLEFLHQRVLESPAVIVGGESKLDPDAYTCRNCGRKSTPSTETPRETDVVTAFSLATEASV